LARSPRSASRSATRAISNARRTDPRSFNQATGNR
jgi:hypothetical protein